MGQAIRLDSVGEGGYDFRLMRDVVEGLGSVLFDPGRGRGGRRSCSGGGGHDNIILMIERCGEV
jgi:hypothetical protein